MNLASRASSVLIRSLPVSNAFSSYIRPLSALTIQSMPSDACRRVRNSRLLLYASSMATAYTWVTMPRRALAEFSTVATPASETSIPDIVLYQYEVCPFCNKVRAYLDYQNIPYRVVEVDPLRKTELKRFSEDYRKVPIAIVNGEQVNGSGNVIDHVHKLMNGSKAKLSDVESRWIRWLEEYFIHLVAPNIYRSLGESLQTFAYIADNAKFSAWQRSTIRYTGATAMYFVGKKIKKKYEIEDERVAIHEAVREWTSAIRDGGGKFLDGRDKPGVADLSVYGVLRAIQTFDTFKELREKNPALAEWFDETKEAVGEECVTERQ